MAGVIRELFFPSGMPIPLPNRCPVRFVQSAYPLLHPAIASGLSPKEISTMKNHTAMKTLGGIGLAALINASAFAVDADRLAALEKGLADTQSELAALKGERNDLAVITEEKQSKFTFGGYGEIHANFTDGGSSYLDIHRFVLFLGYQFNEWIRLSSEVELEHAWTDEGYVLIEQLYADFFLSDPISIRAGRMLAPLGIVNQNHEPTLFLGAERPNVAKYIIPSTWSIDGAGLFGAPVSWLTYEVYGVAGLEGQNFDGSDGIRGGRMKGRQGLDDPAITGRIDLFPVSTDNQDLRLGLSGYYGGTDNAPKGGTGTPSVDNTLAMYSADFSYTLSRFRFNGVVAHGNNSNAQDLEAAYGNGTGEELFGWYIEGGVDVMPASWKTGKLKESSFIPFIRYDHYDTQYKVPGNVVKDDANDRSEITVGVNWLLTRNFVIKADTQFLSNEAIGSDVNNKYNLGLGWVFN